MEQINVDFFFQSRHICLGLLISVNSKEYFEHPENLCLISSQIICNDAQNILTYAISLIVKNV